MRNYSKENITKIYNLLDAMKTSSKLLISEDEFSKVVHITTNLQTGVLTGASTSRSDVTIPEDLKSMVLPTSASVDETRGAVNFLEDDGKVIKYDYDEYLNLIYKLYSCFRKSPHFNVNLKDIPNSLTLAEAVKNQEVNGLVAFNENPFIPISLKVNFKEEWCYSYSADRMIIDYFKLLFTKLGA